VKYAFIQEHLVEDYPVEVACLVLEVSRSGYYAWCRRSKETTPSPRHCRREQLLVAIGRVYGENRQVVGSPRVFKALQAEGIKVSQNTVAKLMRQQGIAAKAKRKFVPKTTDSAHDQPVAVNRLDRRFSADLPNQKWVTDITYIPTEEGWLYLAGVMDICSRKIVGWAMEPHMRVELVTKALTMAIGRCSPKAGLLHHSDRGIQYASDDYQHLLSVHQMIPSMSGKGNCWDNAVMESFWSTLKTELVHHEHYATREEAKASIFEYIEVFYNRKRLHSALGYRSPEAFEAGLN
jgi:transposase InsO family protein